MNKDILEPPEEVTELIEQIEDIAEHCDLSYEEKLFFVDVLVAFWGAEEPGWDEMSGEISDNPKVKEALKEYFIKNKLRTSDIELQ